MHGGNYQLPYQPFRCQQIGVPVQDQGRHPDLGQESGRIATPESTVDVAAVEGSPPSSPRYRTVNV